MAHRVMVWPLKGASGEEDARMRKERKKDEEESRGDEQLRKIFPGQTKYDAADYSCSFHYIYYLFI